MLQQCRKKGEINTDGVITWSGFNSQCMWICQTSTVIRLISSHYFLILCGYYPWTKWCSQFLNQTHMLALGSDLPLHPICKELQWEYSENISGYISDATSTFCTFKRRINWLWERFCVSQADVLFSGRADSTLSDHHTTCSIYVNQDGADKQIIRFWYQNTTATQGRYMYISAHEPRNISKLCMNDHKWHCCSSSQFIWKKLSFQSNGSGLVLANTIGKFLSIFGTTARLIFIILVNSVTVISYLNRL